MLSQAGIGGGGFALRGQGVSAAAKPAGLLRRIDVSVFLRNPGIAFVWRAAARQPGAQHTRKPSASRCTTQAVAVPDGRPVVPGTAPARRLMLGHGLAVALLSGGIFAYAASPFVLMQALGAGSFGYVGLLAMSMAGFMAGSLASSRLGPVLDHRGIVLGGFALGAAAGLALLAFAAAGRASLAAVATLLAVYTFARSLVVPLATVAATVPMGHAAGAAFGWLGAWQMAAAVLATAGAGLFGDPLLGRSAMLALFATAALGCGLHANGLAGIGGRRAGFSLPENGLH
jgi:hypothetical protein